MKKRKNLRRTEKTRRGRKEKSPASFAAFMIQEYIYNTYRNELFN